MAHIFISRDPFARTEVSREIVLPSCGQDCQWCGGLNKRGKLFRYITESDGGRSYPHTGLFCSKPCHDSYHNF